MNEKEAIKICEEHGWEVSKGYHLHDETGEDDVVFETLEELIKYATEIKED